MPLHSDQIHIVNAITDQINIFRQYMSNDHRILSVELYVVIIYFENCFPANVQREDSLKFSDFKEIV